MHEHLREEPELSPSPRAGAEHPLGGAHHSNLRARGGGDPHHHGGDGPAQLHRLAGQALPANGRVRDNTAHIPSYIPGSPSSRAAQLMPSGSVEPQSLSALLAASKTPVGVAGAASAFARLDEGPEDLLAAAAAEPYPSNGDWPLGSPTRSMLVGGVSSTHQLEASSNYQPAAQQPAHSGVNGFSPSPGVQWRGAAGASPGRGPAGVGSVTTSPARRSAGGVQQARPRFQHHFLTDRAAVAALDLEIRVQHGRHSTTVRVVRTVCADGVCARVLVGPGRHCAPVGGWTCGVHTCKRPWLLMCILLMCIPQHREGQHALHAGDWCLFAPRQAGGGACAEGQSGCAGGGVTGGGDVLTPQALVLGVAVHCGPSSAAVTSGQQRADPLQLLVDLRPCCCQRQ